MVSNDRRWQEVLEDSAAARRNAARLRAYAKQLREVLALSADAMPAREPARKTGGGGRSAFHLASRPADSAYARTAIPCGACERLPISSLTRPCSSSPPVE
jgi:hypothetical protein